VGGFVRDGLPGNLEVWRETEDDEMELRRGVGGNTAARCCLLEMQLMGNMIAERWSVRSTRFHRICFDNALE